MLTVIVARARDGAIGRGGEIPWHAPEDLAFFSRETRGGAVIMGRRTWESLPMRPLPARTNILVARDANLHQHVATSPELAIEMAREMGHLRVYAIGGAGIYRTLTPLADRLLITEVDTLVPDADTFFDPELQEWSPIAQLTLRHEAPRCTVTEYLRGGDRRS